MFARAKQTRSKTTDQPRRHRKGKFTRRDLAWALALALVLLVSNLFGMDNDDDAWPDQWPQLQHRVTDDAEPVALTGHATAPVNLDGTVTYGEFATALLAKIDAPHTDDNWQFLVLWQLGESGTSSKVHNNPLNTTWKVPGARVFNSHGVKHYQSIKVGLNSTAKTIRLDYYTDLLDKLRGGRASTERLARELADTPWGTGDLIYRLVRDGADPHKTAKTTITGT